MSKQPGGGRHSLRALLVWPFVLLTLFTGATVGVLSYYNARQAVKTVALGVRTEVTQRVHAHLETFFAIPRKINRLNALALSSGAVDPVSKQTLTAHFRRQLAVFESVTSIYFGNAAGGLAGAGREGALGSFYATGTDGFAKGPFQKIRTDLSGHPSRTLLTLPDFDARTRPWYRAAVEKQGPAWSDIYVLFTGDGMAIAPSHPVFDREHRLLGVVAVDIFLSHIGDFLRSVHRQRPGRTVVLEPSGLLVASSADAPLLSVGTDGEPGRRLAVWESADAVTRGLGHAVRRTLDAPEPITAERHWEIVIAGDPYFLELAPFRDEDGLSLLIAVATPQSAYLEPISAGNRTSLGLILVALALTALVGALIGERIARPILRLNESARRIAAGDLTHRIAMTRRDEVGQLARSFDGMAEKLQKAFQLQVDQLDELKAREEALRESEERVALATEAARIGIWDLDLRNDRLVWDPTMFQLFGVAPDSFAGTYKAWQRTVHPDDLPHAVAGANQAMASRRDRHRAVFRILWPDGSVRHIEAYMAFKYDDQGRPERMFGVNIDVTAVKSAEEALRFEKEKAEAANAAKSRFLATMSHELRTPLNAIIGFAGLLLMREEHPERREHLQIIHEAGENLLRLIGDILDLSRIEAGRTEVQPVTGSLRGELQRVVSMFAKEVQKCGLSLDLVVAPDVPETVRVDFDLLRRILINLIGNAVKFTPQGGIVVRAGLSEPADGSRRHFLFSVTDTGIGIEAGDLERIFDSFEQAHETLTRETSGSGLGLSICRRLVALMGGRIWVESRPGDGTTFSFTVAFETPPESVAERDRTGAPGPSARACGLKVLVVEDDRFNRLLLDSLLSGAGFQVACVDDGPAALEALGRTRFDLVLMDIQLPGLDGIEVTRRIRSGRVPDCPPTLPVIAVTAFAIEGDEARFLAAGLDAYVSKPIDHRGLLQCIDDLLVSRSTDRLG